MNKFILKIFKLKNYNSKNISRNFSGTVVDSVGSIHLQIVPWSGLYFFSRSIGTFLCSRCWLQGFNLLHLSLLKRIPLFILPSSVYWSLQHLISALTQGGDGGHFFRLTCSVVLSGGSNTADKYHWRVWEVLTGFQPPWVCPRSLRVCFHSTLLRLYAALPGTIWSGPWVAFASQV